MRLNASLFLAFTIGLLFSASAASVRAQEAAPNANALFVEAVLMFRKSESLDAPQAETLRRQVKQNFDLILENYPESRAADEIRKGMPAGIDVSALPQSEGNSEQAALSEQASPNEAALECLTDQYAGGRDVRLTISANLDPSGGLIGIPALEAPAAPDPVTRAAYLQFVTALESCNPTLRDFAQSTIRTGVGDDGALFFQPELSAGQIVPESEPVLPAANTIAPPSLSLPATKITEAELSLQRKDVRDIQARLLVLGFDPNGIDGLLGPGTRAALSNWQNANRMGPTGFLNVEQRALLQDQSQSQLDVWLQDKVNADKYDPPIIPLGPRAMSGNWRFTSTCGPNSKLGNMKITGALSVSHAGGNSYSGSARQSQGFKGKFTGRLNGRRIDGQINWGLLVGTTKFTGKIADNALIIRGSDTNRCAFYARKP